MKQCAKCSHNKDDNEFAPSQFNNRSGWCRACVKIKSDQYYQDHKEEIALKREGEKEDRSLYDQKYYQENRNKKLEYGKVYREENPDKIRDTNKKYTKNKRKIDRLFRSHEQISSSIRKYLKLQGFSKNGASINDFLPWTWEEYKIHMENWFSHPDNLTPEGKVWMTWENQGVYHKKDWDDNNSETWKWQLDHIIPHSTFHYTSMDSQEFCACWVLSNLRPLSAKQNQLDGATKIRHAI